MTTSVVKPALKLWVALYSPHHLVLQPSGRRPWMNVTVNQSRSAVAWLGRSTPGASGTLTPSPGYSVSVATNEHHLICQICADLGSNIRAGTHGHDLRACATARPKPLNQEDWCAQHAFRSDHIASVISRFSVKPMLSLGLRSVFIPVGTRREIENTNAAKPFPCWIQLPVSAINQKSEVKRSRGRDWLRVGLCAVGAVPDQNPSVVR